MNHIWFKISRFTVMCIITIVCHGMENEHSVTTTTITISPSAPITIQQANKLSTPNNLIPMQSLFGRSPIKESSSGNRLGMYLLMNNLSETTATTSYASKR